MNPRRSLLAWWVGANAAVFLLWLHFVLLRLGTVIRVLTVPAGQATLAVSVLLAGWALYIAVAAGLARRSAGRRLFPLAIKWKQFFVAAGIFLAVTTVSTIFLSQVSLDPLSLIGNLAKMAAAFFAGTIGLVETGVTARGLLTPFALVPWPDVESYRWLDDRRIMFRAKTRLAGCRFRPNLVFDVEAASRKPLDAFLTTRLGQP